MREERSKILMKVGAAQRYIFWQGYIPFIRHYYVSEFPKSGGTWFCQMLSESIDVSFPRNQMATWSECILHSHILPSDGQQAPVMILRDGRDVLVSAYHHFIIGHSISPSFLISHWRNKMPYTDYDNIRKNLATFIEVFFKEFRSGNRNITWNDFAQYALSNPNCLSIRYEELLTQPQVELQRAIKHIGLPVDLVKIDRAIAKYSFENQAKRTSGIEDNAAFLRKGISGDWKNYFDYNACQTFDNLAGEKLIQLGYEKDHSWY